MIFFMGCATEVPQTPAYLASQVPVQIPSLKRVALVAILTSPEIEPAHLGWTRSEGTALGASGGALRGTAAAFEGLSSCGGAYCGAAFLLLLPVFVLGGAVVGAVSGADAGYAADELAKAEANANRMLTSAFLQDTLFERTKEYGVEYADLDFVRTSNLDHTSLAEEPAYRAASNDDIDVVLEFELLKLSLEQSLEMKARARLILARTDAVLSDAEYQFISERRSLEEWMANGAAPLTEAIHRGLESLAEDVIDENFLLFYPTKPEPIGSAEAGAAGDGTQASRANSVPHYVLSPTYPPLDFCFFCEGLFSNRPHRAIGNLEFVEVDSLQPTLRWESFPRDYDRIGFDGQQRQITNVRYEVRVFETALPSRTNLILVPARQVYDKRDISGPEHRIESELAACSDYFWTVRARFNLDGRARVTEWAGAFAVAGWDEKPWNLRRHVHSYPKWVPILPDGPEWFYYPFKTPCD